ncbi:bifunctional diaminohydroxyphosphoribosylaminopyrimidine deaminase/5-amino-6-(5-phosphoribosylamino)uracil reductase RibD [Shewanella surugensis]|uniref:Riboflavin biosynthesis protein RibD n=1 Tax=Shewanella surugensis TaxID=212020 RepID=A0ABT0L8E3_9GAMM|nr:bifunctional diaminohydroxyphosphoribosylaminopyrimidine deaminase/5-amino-6-(5-phosphoribosylamino)uracil reductase RibD [Shewanella surugensis]MCL1123964.1 bifunctional diaminohydroxyphosphoribosylaminopyrimidine deaminase/5-amino-6-(5-phosphoribosylamino)uracil reductase RibD [Shewanella surugensis]
MWSIQDIKMMNRALKLARKGTYTTRPNPSVGCVITQGDEVIGEGYHIKAGGPHAEVHALNDAGLAAKGSTAYVTLEPCSHYGRTPPCALGLIEAGVVRVVIATEDPNPQVKGRGIAMLKEAGISVSVGLLAAEAKRLNKGFMKCMAIRLPWVTVKLAASLDGKTALSNGVSQWITGPESRRDVQRLRARHGALVTGIETVLADNPSLNVRHSELGELKQSLSETDIIQPIRVILDSRARLPVNMALFEVESSILLVSCVHYPEEVRNAWPEHVSHLLLPSMDGRVDLAKLLEHLGSLCHSVLIEAGATLAGAFMAEGLADELVLYQAIKILGDKGRNLLSLPEYGSMAMLPSMTLIDERKVGADTRLTLKLG